MLHILNVKNSNNNNNILITFFHHRTEVSQTMYVHNWATTHLWLKMATYVRLTIKIWLFLSNPPLVLVHCRTRSSRLSHSGPTRLWLWGNCRTFVKNLFTFASKLDLSIFILSSRWFLVCEYIIYWVAIGTLGAIWYRKAWSVLSAPWPLSAVLTGFLLTLCTQGSMFLHLVALKQTWNKT